MDYDRHDYVLCIDNAGCPASLQVRKVYPSLKDESAARHGMIRVIDESGEDYLFPRDCFVRIELPQRAARAFSTAA